MNKHNRLLMNIVSQKSRFLFVLVILLGVLGISQITSSMVNANPYPRLSNRSLTIGTTEPGEITSYTVTWQFPVSTGIGSVRFVLCADPYVLDACSMTPAGDMSAGVLSSQSGVTGFGITSQSANEILMARAPGVVGTGQSTYVFDNIVNPTGVHSRFYWQIFTYPTADGSGTPSFISSVATATASPIVINTKVPPILYFCAALTIDEWCNTVDGNFIDYGALDAVNGHSATSQFGAATNALGGYVVTVNGKTMTSGNKKVEPLTSPAAYSVGQPQFGLNLRANLTPALGQDPFGDGTAVLASDYDLPDVFKFEDGAILATSATGTVFNIFTVTYILNIPPDLPSGVYNTTLVYICTASF